MASSIASSDRVVDAFPRTDVDTALAQDAFRLIDVEELLGPQLVLEVVAFNECELIVIPDGRRLVDNAPGHQSPPVMRGRP